MSTGHRIAICAAPIVILVIAVLLVASVFLLGANEIPSSAGASSANQFDYTITPLAVTRDSKGAYNVRVEIVKKDSWYWKTVSVRDVSVKGQTKAKAKLVLATPGDPIPERFVLEFSSDVIAANESELFLSFTLGIEGSKDSGLVNGNSSQSHIVALKPNKSSEK